MLNVASTGISGLCSGLQGVFKHLLKLGPVNMREITTISTWNKSRKTALASNPFWFSFQEEIVKMIAENIGKKKYIFELSLKKDWMNIFIRQKLSGK